MTDLTTTDPGSLHAIAARAEHACIVFPEHRLPEGCRPDHADVGIESHSGRFLLHVRAGTTYDGSDVAVAQWVRIGTRSFPSMDDCIAWLRGRLAETTDQPTARRTLSMAPNELTDITQVQVGPTRITADDLERALRRDVLGQDDAVRGLSELAATHLARVRPRRPASALLVGPTGSGKTLAAEALAEQLRASTGVPWGYQRLDMSEFSESHAAARLFGSPPGYIGYRDGMNLASALRGSPRSIVLFDEIDKAHPQLWHSLMNLMDAGRLNGQGGDLDARAAILLFTSNRDATGVQALGSASDAQLRAFLRERGYPPEVVARIGRVLPFRPLSPAMRIDLLVLTVQRVVDSFGLRLAHIEPNAVSTLLRDAPLEAGGRDVEYFVERALANQLAELAGAAEVVSVHDGTPLRVVTIDGGRDE
jgi:ATP-dependent Clp protease ATP-binding subunit ClpC